MQFIKMHGTGNDYVYVDGFAHGMPPRPAELARAVSHRHFGIGSDGLIIIMPTEEADAEMIMYNADGSLSEMCGNGLRCVAKYVHDHIVRKDQLLLKTGAGLKVAHIFRGANGLAEDIELEMGVPILAGLEIPTTWDLPQVINQDLEILGNTYQVTCVSMGNPHCVIYVDNVQNFPVEQIGSLIEHHPRFPRRVNVEFVQIVSRTELIQRTWERGAGETWACGTGASAVCVAGCLTGRSASEVRIRLLGGDLFLRWPGLNQSVYMRGNAVEVFRGDYPWH